MRKPFKHTIITLRSFSGLLLILNSLVMPQFNAAIFQPADTPLAPNSVEISNDAPAAPIKPATSRIIYVTVTAYSSTPDQTDDTPFITASGARVRDGIIAANFLRFGAKVKFPDYSGDKIYEVTDRMNARYPNRADIWMATREAALDFGIRTLKMEILPATLAEK